jgi:hypothetical protein
MTEMSINSSNKIQKKTFTTNLKQLCPLARTHTQTRLSLRNKQINSSQLITITVQFKSRKCSSARTLGSWVRIPLEVWMFVGVCVVLAMR